MRALFWILLAAAGCERRAAVDAGAEALPWQPHGLRALTVTCEMEAPPSLARSPSPMPDHLAEFLSKTLPPRVSVIVAERVEASLPAAIERVNAFHRAGLLTSPGAKASSASLEGGPAPGQSITVRWGAEEKAQLESVTLLAFPGLPIVEVVARYEEADPGAPAAVAALVQSLRCGKK
jgi:hypothetical protein